MSSTFFTAAPDWRWLIILYFFLGGLAGGCYFLAVLVDLFAPPGVRPLARRGFGVAFPGVGLCGVLRTCDVARPGRFWRMLVRRGSRPRMLQGYSPMSVGAWRLLVSGGFWWLSFRAAVGGER